MPFNGDAMPALSTQLKARSPEFKASTQWMHGLVADLTAQLDKIRQGGGDAARTKHVARGKLLPRERVEMLLDADAPFLEIGALAGCDMY